MTILELAVQIGLSPQWKASTAGGEYHSPCPLCGGKDRFFIQPNKQMSNCMGSYSCRQCGINGDAIQFARQFMNLSFHDALKTVDAMAPEKPVGSILKKRQTTLITLQRPPNEWIANATRYVEQAHKKLMGSKNNVDFLAHRGLSIAAIQRYKIGLSDKNEFLSRTDWGLDEQLLSNGKPRLLWMPKGLVIPSYESNGKIVRLKIRQSDWKHGDDLPKYVAISGGMNGLILIGNTKRNVMVVVESELDAYAIDHLAHDFVCAVAVGSNIKNPDNVTDHLAKKVDYLLICHDNDEAGKKMLTKWQNLYSHAKSYPTPIGKDIGEAIQQGFDIRQWLVKAVCESPI